MDAKDTEWYPEVLSAGKSELGRDGVVRPIMVNGQQITEDVLLDANGRQIPKKDLDEFRAEPHWIRYRLYPFADFKNMRKFRKVYVLGG